MHAQTASCTEIVLSSLVLHAWYTILTNVLGIGHLNIYRCHNCGPLTSCDHSFTLALPPHTCAACTPTLSSLHSYLIILLLSLWLTTLLSISSAAFTKSVNWSRFCFRCSLCYEKKGMTLPTISRYLSTFSTAIWLSPSSKTLPQSSNDWSCLTAMLPLELF